MDELKSRVKKTYGKKIKRIYPISITERRKKERERKKRREGGRKEEESEGEREEEEGGREEKSYLRDLQVNNKRSKI